MSAEKVVSELTVAILPLGQISTSQITLTEDVLKREFGVKTIVLPEMEIPVQCYNYEQNEYLYSKTMAFLLSQLPTNAQRIVGINNGHLGIYLKNNKTRIRLGFADPFSLAAIYGAPNLLDQQSDPKKNQFGQDVSYHLIVHEFAHTFDIMHCARLECAMNETQFKTTLCDNCRRWAGRELRVVPGSAEECFSRAEAFLKHNCLQKGIIAYFKALSKASHEPLYHLRLGWALFRVGLKKAADRQALLATTLAKDNDDLDYSFGIFCLNTDLAQAEDYFAKAITKAKDPKFMQRLVGQAYREITHDVERASRHYLEYLRLGGDEQDVVDWLVSRSKLDKP